MIRIKRLRLTVPHHLRHEAQAVARLTADRLARDHAQVVDATIDRFQVGPVTAARGTSSQQVAGSVSNAIGRAIAAKRGQGQEG
jgi:hypothetical protein